MIEPTQTLFFRRGRLPHWLVSDRSFFVTLCRKGSLPARVVTAYRAEREALRSEVEDNRTANGETRCSDNPDAAKSSEGRPGPRRVSCTAAVSHDSARSGTSRAYTGRGAAERATTDARRLARWQQRFLQIDAMLDAADRSDPVLCMPSVAEVILGNLNGLRDRGWRIWAATLMPSHLHMVVRNHEGRNAALCSDLAQYMAYTARRANKILVRSGAFWQPEPFDHWCRDPEAWCRSVSYTLQNPVKVGLCASWRDWPYTAADTEVEAIIE